MSKISKNCRFTKIGPKICQNCQRNCQQLPKICLNVPKICQISQKNYLAPRKVWNDSTGFKWFCTISPILKNDCYIATYAEV